MLSITHDAEILALYHPFGLSEDHITVISQIHCFLKSHEACVPYVTQ